MRNDTLALTMDEKILRAFKEQTDAYLEIAEGLLRQRLELARETDAEREGAVAH